MNTSDDKSLVDALVLEQYALRWAVLAAWRDALRLRQVTVPDETSGIFESVRTKIVSGCFSVCDVGCELSRLEATLTSADSSTTHNWVDFWVDMLATAMSKNPDDVQRILKVPAIKARFQDCGLGHRCRC
jgi:hypothetical protein